MTTSQLSMTVLMSSPTSILPVICRSGNRAAQLIKAWPMRPLAPVITTRVILLFEDAAFLQRGADEFAIFWLERDERETKVGFHHAHHRESGLHRAWICLDK